MAKVRPFHAVAGVLLFGTAILAADYAVDGGFHQAGYEGVAPENGQVILDVADLPPSEVKFYRFLNTGNQEVKFFVGRDPKGHVVAAFDANEICYKTKRGFRHEGDWVACNSATSPSSWRRSTPAAAAASPCRSNIGRRGSGFA